MAKFIHCADIHIDSPLSGLSYSQKKVPDSIAQATRTAFCKLIDFTLDQQVELLVIAGDLFHNDAPSLETGRFVYDQLFRCHEKGIRVVLIQGNHDAVNPNSFSFQYPDQIFELSSQTAQTVLFEDLKIAVHGQSYPQRQVFENLAKNYPQGHLEYYNIGVLHTSFEGNENHDNYAPCNLQDLLSKGYQYWALGHIHQREVLHHPQPYIVYSGNLQGRHAKETLAKGAYLVETEGQQTIRHQFYDFDEVRWQKEAIQLEGKEDLDWSQQVVEQLQSLDWSKEDRPTFLRLELYPQSQPLSQQLFAQWQEKHQLQLRALLENHFKDLYLEKIKLFPAPVNSENYSGLDRTLQKVLQDQVLFQETSELFQQDQSKTLSYIRSKLPPDLRLKFEGIQDPQALKELGQQQLMAQLKGGHQDA